MVNIIKLQRTFKDDLDPAQINELLRKFEDLDTNDKGWIDERTAIDAVKGTEGQSYDHVRAELKALDNASGQIDQEDYIKLVVGVRRESKNKQSSAGKPAQAPQSRMGHASKGSVSNTKTIHVGGTSSNIVHSIDEDERTEFTRHINAVLAGDPDIGDRLPFPTDSFQMFDQCRDGLVLAKLINDSVPDTIDERVLNRPGVKIKSLNAFHETENNNVVIQSAKGIGCSVVNIGSADIKKGTEHLILGLIWQIIRKGLLNKIDIKLHPELYRLLYDENEDLKSFLRLSPEKILLRWFNYHLRAAEGNPGRWISGGDGAWKPKVTNFSSDIQDSRNYTKLLAQIAPEHCDKRALQTADDLQRAEQVLQNADRIDCRKFLTPSAIVKGNAKLNLAFVANLFNTWPALDPITEEEKVEVDDFDADGDREARVYTLWLNSLDVKPPVNNLYSDVRDGTILLQAYDKVIPGSVQWNRVNQRKAKKPDEEEAPEIPKFKALENTNYAVMLGVNRELPFRFSLQGIQGADIEDGTRTPILALVWQLMRRDISETLSALARQSGKREITDAEMVEWANSMSAKGGKSSKIRGFGDKSIGSGVFFLDVLNGMKSSYVDYDLVTPGRTDDDAYMNAKLSISIARKMGATIWLLPEDICQARSKLCTTFVASLMATNEKMR